MKKILFALLLPLSAVFVGSCSGSDKETERQRQYEDSVRRAESIAAVERAAIEQARIDSIRQDSIAKAELQSQESKKIDKLLKEYAECVKVIRRDYYQDGEFDYPSRFVWENFISPTYELFKKLKKMEGDMTPEQKTKFQNLSKQIKEVVG